LEHFLARRLPPPDHPFMHFACSATKHSTEKTNINDFLGWLN
jgi:hypothetical protein